MTEEFEVKIGRVSLEGFTTDELVKELSKRDDVTRYPSWVGPNEVFERHRMTLDGKYVLLVVRE